jgi:hypothetical protein
MFKNVINKRENILEKNVLKKRRSVRKEVRNSQVTPQEASIKEWGKKKEGKGSRSRSETPKGVITTVHGQQQAIGIESIAVGLHITAPAPSIYYTKEHGTFMYGEVRLE